jgi:hypothetical protein
LKNAQKPDHVSLSTLLGWLREGRYVVPDFQREFEWQPWDIRDLVRSIFLDYYIGSLLLWKGKRENFDALSCEAIYGFGGAARPEYIVLDGQQRLTALYYAFLGPKVKLPNRSGRALYWVKIDQFMAEQYDQAFSYDWASKRLEGLFSDREALFAAHIFPCSVVGAGGWELPNWLQSYERFWSEKAAEAAGIEDDAGAAEARRHAENARVFGQHLADLTSQYQISFIELDEDLGIDKVCDIFTQLNSKGVRLDIFDLMNALLKPKGLQLKHMWRTAAGQLDFVATQKMNVYVLQVMSILRQAYCSPKYLYFLLPGQTKPIRGTDGSLTKEVLVPTITDFEVLWNRSVTALADAIRALRHPQEFGAVSSKYLPYASILPVFAALQTHLKSCPVEVRFGGQRKIRQWYWASVFTNRYSGSVESTSARDFIDVRAWIDGTGEEPAPIQEFKSRFASLDLRRETNSSSSVYNGIFNLLVLAGARDWMTGSIPPHDDLDDHHIVPLAWGARHLQGNIVHSILNRTPLTSETNRTVIGQRLPNTYLPGMVARNGETAVRATLESHLISPAAFDILLRDSFGPNDFEEFISERQRTLHDAIESLLIKERLDLAPKLRELDIQVESIELRLRQTINDALAGDVTSLPPHVVQKVTERFRSAERKNPGIDSGYHATLLGKLEYCDLREIQDTVVAKSTWPLFERCFLSKDLLSIRFGQLAELRNALRHSRSVDQITQKDGEVAVLWFNQALSR